MPKSKFNTSFNFGANVRSKKAASSGKKGRRGKRCLSQAQKATAMYYMQPKRR
jgi:hypothetical protein